MFFNNLSPILNQIQQQEVPEVSDEVELDSSVVIETLERRIAELEKEITNLKEDDSRPWCFDMKQPGYIKSGLSFEQFNELEKVSRHYNSKTNSNLWLMMAQCWQAPIPTREKMVLFFLCIVHANPGNGGMK
jgi:hypothetical protein